MSTTICGEVYLGGRWQTTVCFGAASDRGRIVREMQKRFHDLPRRIRTYRDGDLTSIGVECIACKGSACPGCDGKPTRRGKQCRCGGKCSSCKAQDPRVRLKALAARLRAKLGTVKVTPPPDELDMQAILAELRKAGRHTKNRSPRDSPAVAAADHDNARAAALADSRPDAGAAGTPAGEASRQHASQHRGTLEEQEAMQRAAAEAAARPARRREVLSALMAGIAGLIELGRQAGELDRLAAVLDLLRGVVDRIRNGKDPEAQAQAQKALAMLPGLKIWLASQRLQRAAV